MVTRTHVGLPGGLAHFVDALARRKFLQLYLPRKHRGLFFIKQRKQRHMLQRFRIARHGSPLL
jgi:hypothetical protein